MKGLLQVLPPEFDLIDGSYTGPSSVFTKTWVTDHWELDWNFSSPLPKVNSESSYPIPFKIGATLQSGTHNDFGTGYVYYSATGAEVQAGSLLDKIAMASTTSRSGRAATRLKRTPASTTPASA